MAIQIARKRRHIIPGKGVVGKKDGYDIMKQNRKGREMNETQTPAALDGLYYNDFLCIASDMRYGVCPCPTTGRKGDGRASKDHTARPYFVRKQRACCV